MSYGEGMDTFEVHPEQGFYGFRVMLPMALYPYAMRVFFPYGEDADPWVEHEILVQAMARTEEEAKVTARVHVIAMMVPYGIKLDMRNSPPPEAL